MDLTTNGVVSTRAIKYVHTDKEKLMSKEENGKESEEPDYDEDKGQLEEKEGEETGGLSNADQVF